MKINKVVVVGSGTMGSGIAAQLCNANIPVTLLDLKTEISQKAKERIEKSRPPLLIDKSIWGEKYGNISRSDQKIIVPLKELCRKFVGYSHVGMSSVPTLKITHRIESEIPTVDIIRRNMTAKHHSLWTKGNKFSVPEEWIEISSDLYGREKRLTEPLKKINIVSKNTVSVKYRIIHKLKAFKRSLRKLRKFLIKTNF